jgi:hypothetical protein
MVTKKAREMQNFFANKVENTKTQMREGMIANRGGMSRIDEKTKARLPIIQSHRLLNKF